MNIDDGDDPKIRKSRSKWKCGIKRDFLVANLVEQTARQRRLIHWVNYDARNTPLISSRRCTARVPSEKVVKEAMMYEVGADLPRPLSPTSCASSATFRIPEMKTYAVIGAS